MTKVFTSEDFAGFRNKLTVLRARLRGDVSTMADVALNKNRLEASGDLSVMPIHMADVGTDNFEQEFTLSLMQSENEILAQVDQALKRIDEGTYGLCEDCGKSIPKTRLNAIPFASKCVKCAQEAEQKRNHP